MADKTDKAILDHLKTNSRSQWKEIGAKVHLTGQAVAARVQALQDLGVIRSFTVDLDPTKLGRTVHAFITIFMKSNDHSLFIRFVAQDERIIEAHRVGGDGCYLLTASLTSPDELNNLLEEILRHGNYRVQLSFGKLK